MDRLKTVRTLLCLSLSLAAGQYALAAAPTSPLTGNIAVSLTIEPGCSVTPVTTGNQVTGSAQNWANLSFGTQAGGGTKPLSATGGFDIECSKGASPTLAFGQGNNPNTTDKSRQMSDGTDKLDYTLYQHDGKTVVPSTTEPQKSVPNGVYTVIGKTLAPQGIAAGSYTDTVTATLTW